MEAGSLGIGTSIVSRAGPALSVTGVTWHRNQGNEKSTGAEANGFMVYNLTVEDDHTFFVGTTGGGTWVHNANCPRIPKSYSNDVRNPNLPYEEINFGSEGEARNYARQRVGSNPVDIGDNKLRSLDGTKQYRAKLVDYNNNHVHLEDIDPNTGEQLRNLHLNWPEGNGR